jgi:hypothetical protein
MAKLLRHIKVTYYLKITNGVIWFYASIVDQAKNSLNIDP